MLPNYVIYINSVSLKLIFCVNFANFSFMMLKVKKQCYKSSFSVSYWRSEEWDQVTTVCANCCNGNMF